MKVSEYDFTVEHRSNSKMRHADALSRCVHLVAGECALTRDKIREAQSKDPSCAVYKTRENFWVDDEQLLYYENKKGCPLVVIPKALVEAVLRGYHELPFTAHQGIMRTIAAIRRKYWSESLDRDVRECISACEACAKRKIGNRVTAPLGDSLEAQEFLDVVSLDVVGPLPVTDNGNVDHFTRFCEAIPIPTQETEITAKEFVRGSLHNMESLKSY
jgi:hypothetical protein